MLEGAGVGVILLNCQCCILNIVLICLDFFSKRCHTQQTFHIEAIYLEFGRNIVLFNFNRDAKCSNFIMKKLWLST